MQRGHIYFKKNVSIKLKYCDCKVLIELKMTWNSFVATLNFEIVKIPFEIRVSIKMKYSDCKINIFMKLKLTFSWNSNWYEILLLAVSWCIHCCNL